MAHNQLKPNYSSSEEDEEASGSEDDQTSGSESEEAADSDDKPQQEPQKTLIPPPKSTIKPQAPDISSEPEDSGSETDTDSDSNSPAKKSAVADPNIKPIRSVPMEREESGSNLESASAKKSGSSQPTERSKRPAAVPPATEKDLKKAKTNSATDDDSKKQLFQRLWSEDDEIVILKGMIDYKAENGENFISDMGAFHEFIKKSLHVDVSRAQLVDKIRRLKKKYVNNAGREKNGKDRTFSKSHEQKGYELSKLIWGSGSYANSSGTEGKKNSKSQKNGNGTGTGPGTGTALVKLNGLDDKEVTMMEVEKSMDISRFVRYGGRGDGPVLVEEIVKAGMELVEGSERVELEERWRSLKKEELELYLKKMELVKEQALVVLEAVNSS